ncbi:endonuclease/exonuclease/phosphatase family protein [Nocardioides sp. cx-169]|uniref:endonuclease/exonuclease/phosphatase family protein n=1 Tax=Nocardioides sp. cx-169 TaxID=2899080 RepID=UPI001E32405A|nr:endonuclease/exonuclease/phosphatase family protein [Nocardioides sp. cx-169]MCD4534166.1 endonuclease/exonuclease/phosphatase family protein [Nocardioides sp. cx-169]
MPRPKTRARSHRAERGNTFATLLLVGLLILVVGAVTLLGGSGFLARDAGTAARMDAPVPGDPGTTAASPSVAPTRTPAVSRKPPGKRTVVPGLTLRRYTTEELAEIEAERLRAIAARKPVTIRVGTFNVLGSNHTAPGGDRRNYPPASRRTPQAASYIRNYGVQVLGTQELKPDQLNGLKSMTGMAAYPDYAFGTRDTDNNILYDPDVFEFVSGDSFSITFMHAVRPQPIVKLRHRLTGREMYFVNMHASAGEGRYAVSRRAGHLAAVSVVNRLASERLPVFLTGDMNDRAEFFCRVAPPTGLAAAIGGSTSGGCSPAGRLAVDWVLGTGVQWSDYDEDRSTLGRVSDHHFVSATATIPGETD